MKIKVPAIFAEIHNITIERDAAKPDSVLMFFAARNGRNEMWLRMSEEDAATLGAELSRVAASPREVET